MKKCLSLLLVLTMLLSLCACGAQEETAPVMSTPEAVPVTEAPTEAPEEPVTELVFSEEYSFRYEEDSRIFDLYLTLYPLSSRCSITTHKGNHSFAAFSGNYTEENGLIIVDNGTEKLELRRGEEGLTLKKGSLTAYCGGVWTEEHIYTDYEGEPLPKEVGPGTVFENPSNGYTAILDGIYVMDDSEYEQKFDEVLLDIDLTNMAFALKCYDGYVVSGDLEFEAGDYQAHLICRYEGGALAFSIWDRWDRNDDGSIIHDPVLQGSSSATVPKGQLMYCPPEGNYLDDFYFAPERDDEIVADPDVVSLDSIKTLTYEYFFFSQPVVADDYSDCYGLGIYHFVLPDVWEFHSNSRSVVVEAVETDDGRITFSYEGKTWNFHREKGTIVFDGGDPLIIPNEYVDGYYSKQEMELIPGTPFRYSDFSYLYDTLYIIPSWNGGYESALRIDRENQRLVFLCQDGSRVESPYYWEDDAICCVTADSTMRIYPRGHALSVHVPWGINIASGDSQSGSLEYIPTHSTAELEEALVFLAEVPEETPDPAGSILVYENNIAVSLCGYYVLTGDLTLCSHDNTFTFNTTYSAYHTEGTYTEEDGILTLRHSYGTTVLRREGNNLVVESGEPLCMAGQPFTLAEEFYNELPAGTHLPLYTRGLLYHGTYTFGERASVTFDTENRTFTLTDAAGVTYEGSFTLSEKFVNCDAGGKIFQFIPYGGQVRLNQRDIEKVVPEEEDFIFFDFLQ